MRYRASFVSILMQNDQIINRCDYIPQEKPIPIEFSLMAVHGDPVSVGPNRN